MQETWLSELQEQVKKDWKNYVHRRIDLSTARVDQLLPIPGEFIYVEDASDDNVAVAKIRLNRKTNDALDLENGVEIKTIFTQIFITNAALANEWIDIIIGINFEYKKKIEGDICPATFVIAASNATALEKSRADMVCDGVADDVEIQAAIDALPGDGDSDNGGGRISLSGGDFVIASTIELRGMIELIGQGIDVTRLILFSGTDANMFEYVGQGSNNIFCRIACMMWDGNYANQTAGHGIECGDATGYILDLCLEHIFVSGFKEDGIKLFDGWGCKLLDVIIEYCQGYGLQVTNSPNHIKVNVCKIISNVKSGARIVNTTGNVGCTLVGSEFGTADSTGAYYGLEIVNDEQFAITGNLIRGGTHATSYPLHISSGSKYFNVTGNNFWGRNAANYCIYNMASRFFAITSNSFYQYTTAPIYNGGNVVYHQKIAENSAQDMILPVAETTGAKTLAQSDSGSAWYAYENTGATTFTLPSAVRGLTFTFIKWRNFDLIIQAAAGDRINFGTVGKKYRNNSAEDKRASVTIVSVDATDWVILAEHGTWVNDNT